MDIASKVSDRRTSVFGFFPLFRYTETRPARFSGYLHENSSFLARAVNGYRSFSRCMSSSWCFFSRAISTALSGKQYTRLPHFCRKLVARVYPWRWGIAVTVHSRLMFVLLQLERYTNQIRFSLVLWPLFHYLLWQDVATEYASADAHWAPYSAVNEAFAKRVQEVYRPGT